MSMIRCMYVICFFAYRKWKWKKNSWEKKIVKNKNNKNEQQQKIGKKWIYIYTTTNHISIDSPYTNIKYKTHTYTYRPIEWMMCLEGAKGTFTPPKKKILYFLILLFSPLVPPSPFTFFLHMYTHNFSPSLVCSALQFSIFILFHIELYVFMYICTEHVFVLWKICCYIIKSIFGWFKIKPTS